MNYCGRRSSLQVQLRKKESQTRRVKPAYVVMPPNEELDSHPVATVIDMSAFRGREFRMQG